ncbi:MAG: hypothetical protein RXN86_06510 [Vulcanisaeta sp.]
MLPPTNRIVLTGYLLGIATIILAIYLITHPFVTHIYYNGPINNTSITIQTNPSDYIILLARAYNTGAELNVMVIERVPETNITVPQYYSISLKPGGNRTMSFMLVYQVSIDGNGYVTLVGDKEDAHNLSTYIIINSMDISG